MAVTDPLDHVALPEQNFSPVAGILSYLVPGLGQVVQGRIGKGLLFFVCLYFLFFYGQYLGGWRTSMSLTPRQPKGQPNRAEAEYWRTSPTAPFLRAVLDWGGCLASTDPAFFGGGRRSGTPVAWQLSAAAQRG